MGTIRLENQNARQHCTEHPGAPLTPVGADKDGTPKVYCYECGKELRLCNALLEAKDVRCILLEGHSEEEHGQGVLRWKFSTDVLSTSASPSSSESPPETSPT